MQRRALGLCAPLLIVPALALPAAPAWAQALPYRVEITGVAGPLADLLRATSSLVTLQGRPPPGGIGLQRRIADDRGRLITALHSAGYYDGTVAITSDLKPHPAVVTIKASPGPLYHFAGVTMEPVAGKQLPAGLPDAAALGVAAGSDGEAAKVIGAEGRLLKALAAKGYPRAKIAGRTVVANLAAHTLTVHWVVDPDALVYLGPARIEGKTAVDHSLILRHVPWHPGDRYSPAQIDKARSGIDGLGPFKTVNLDLGQTGPDGLTPVIIRVQDQPRHFIGAGADYSSHDGIGGKVYWGDRNLFGGAERLRLELDVARLGDTSLGQPSVTGTAALKSPDVFALNQTLTTSLSVISEETDSYQRNATVLGGIFSRPLGHGLTFGYGTTFQHERIVDFATGATTSNLLGVPLTLAYSGVDNALDPRRGVRSTLAVTPYAGLGATDPDFTVLRWTGSTYHDFSGSGRVIGAVRAGLGSIVGAGTAAIPADKRLYAGGGGSVRGYAYQRVGPLDADGNPAGGRSLIELQSELRIKVTDTIGVVPFLDGGTVADSSTPNLSGGFRWGAGLGLRYYTGFGPIRLDVATPINPQHGDDPVQVYISLGQAF